MKGFSSQRCRLAIALATTALIADVAHSTPMTYSGALNFLAPSQAIWGPGFSSLDFGASGATGSASTVRLSYNTGASTGTVSARFAGNLVAAYDDLVPLSSALSTSIGINFAGGLGNLTTALGAHLNVSATILNNPITIFNQDYSLDINNNFSSRFASPAVTGTDSVTVARAAFGPDIFVASAQAGMDGNIRENARLNTTGVLGKLIATHRDSGIKREVPVDLDVNAGESVLIDLGLEGYWDLQFTGLSLENLFTANFLMDLVPFAEYVIGVNCGDPGTNADNNAEFPYTGCLGDGRASFNLASVSLLSSQFPLDFGARVDLSPFSLRVAAAAPTNGVPEPHALLLLAAALSGLLWARRRNVQEGLSETAFRTGGLARDPM